MREILFAFALVVALASVVVGVAHWSQGAAFIVGGVLLAPLAWSVLADTDDATETAGEDE